MQNLAHGRCSVLFPLPYLASLRDELDLSPYKGILAKGKRLSAMVWEFVCPLKFMLRLNPLVLKYGAFRICIRTSGNGFFPPFAVLEHSTQGSLLEAEARPHQMPNLLILWTWTSQPLQMQVVNCCFYKVSSVRYFVTAAWMEWDHGFPNNNLFRNIVTEKKRGPSGVVHIYNPYYSGSRDRRIKDQSHSEQKIDKTLSQKTGW
jgi:hypothetical protein